MRAARRFAQWYSGRLREQPLVTNAVTSAVLMTVGDRLAQSLERRRVREAAAAGGGSSSRELARATANGDEDPELLAAAMDPWSWESVARTGIMVSWSSCFGSPFFTIFWRRLDLWFPQQTLRSALTKAVITATMASPVTNVGFYSYSTTLEHMAFHENPWSLEGRKKLADTVEYKLRTVLPVTLLRSAQIWVLVNTGNFLLVPGHLRVFVSSVFSLLWNVYLSITQHDAHSDAAPSSPAAPSAPAAPAPSDER